jgi:predicted DNA-binding protein (UPF0251 family)
MAFERVADRRIREAMKDGAFDGLPRRGAIDLEEYFKLPPELRMAYSVLKSAGFVPEEVEWLREVDRLESAVAAAADEATRATLRRKLTDARLKLDLALERARIQRAAPTLE